MYSYYCSIISLLFVILTLYCNFNEARVMCEDRNAGPWKARGYACPIICENVLATIERLKIIDYKLIISRSSKLKSKTKNMSIILKKSSSVNNIIEKREKYWSQNFERKPKLGLRKKIMYKKIKLHLFNHTKEMFEKKECQNILRGSEKKTFWSLMQDCARRSNTDHSQIVKIVMNILNEYGDGYFDEQMTSRLLKSVLGKEIELRHGAHDIPRVLLELSRIVHLVRSLQEYDKFSITLASKHCLNLFVSGCFCNLGYVERDAMCVLPQECLKGINEMDKNYLDRIVFN